MWFFLYRFEGRNWYTPVRGRLWICAGGKQPTQEVIDSVKAVYSHIAEGWLDALLPCIFFN